MFVKMNYRVAFNQSFLNDYELDAFLEVPLTVDDSLVKVPFQLEELISEILKNTPKGQMPNFSS